MTSSRSHLRTGFQTVTPYLIVPEAARMIAFLVQVFDAEEIRRDLHPDGTIMNAELRLGDAIVELGEGGGAWAPLQAGLHIYVLDTDATYQRALAAGASSIYEPADMPYGERSAGVRDYAGNQWFLATYQEPSSDELAVRQLFAQMLAGWNSRDAAAIAALYAEDGSIVGFDGSQMNGRAEIEVMLGGIFADHVTGRYVGKVREVRLLTADSALLRAVSGMVPPGQTQLKPELHAVQSLVAARVAGTWRIALYHNTPAQLHGRPDLVAQLTEELSQLLR